MSSPRPTKIGLLIAAASCFLLGSAHAGGDPRFDCTQTIPGASRCLYVSFAQLAAGGGFSGEIIVTNQGYEDDEAVRLDFFGDDGSPLLLETDAGMESERIFSLASGETRMIPFGLDSEVAIPGYGRLTFSSNGSVRGSLVLRVVSDGALQTEVGVRADIPRSSYTFPVEVDASRGINTGLALANGAFQRVNLPPPSAQGFVISLIELDGTVRGTAVLPVGLNGHISLFLDDPRLFPGLDDFRGSASVSAAVDFGLLALRLESGILTSIANDFGPVFGAFDIQDITAEVLEEEDNDVESRAQMLTPPANISGVIGNPMQPDTSDPSDLFEITAARGQILTVYTVTPRTNGSSLDTYLALQRPDGTVLAVNDQNELIFRNDGFLRLEIPEDGAYIIRVEDFFFGESPDFTYNLLVQLDPVPDLQSVSARTSSENIDKNPWAVAMQEEQQDLSTMGINPDGTIEQGLPPTVMTPIDHPGTASTRDGSRSHAYEHGERVLLVLSPPPDAMSVQLNSLSFCCNTPSIVRCCRAGLGNCSACGAEFQNPAFDEANSRIAWTEPYRHGPNLCRNVAVVVAQLGSLNRFYVGEYYVHTPTRGCP